ncbi:hypothetical protein [Janthinobacterium fluminis]|uniref:Uncharacterized protein n=1 Tax=Janthinobacterium fluminis TaxID=2987524 RepID=A0ABT5K5C0_9BURK|nr:hypothetical protein [Janthinobacterium fluminis]MDC8760186.1 hypothetical protein [Janthinobacterium fluminis]
MKRLTSALLFAALACPVANCAAGKTSTASFQSTFTVNEACAVKSNAGRPLVQCQYGAPSQVRADAGPAGPAATTTTTTITTTPRAQVWTVTF